MHIRGVFWHERGIFWYIRDMQKADSAGNGLFFQKKPFAGFARGAVVINDKVYRVYHVYQGYQWYEVYHDIKISRIVSILCIVSILSIPTLKKNDLADDTNEQKT